MRKAKIENVQARLGDYVARSARAKQPLLILHNGEPVAMLVGLERKKPQTAVKLRNVLRRAWKDYETHGGIPHEEFWRSLANEENHS